MYINTEVRSVKNGLENRRPLNESLLVSFRFGHQKAAFPSQFWSRLWSGLVDSVFCIRS